MATFEIDEKRFEIIKEAVSLHEKFTFWSNLKLNAWTWNEIWGLIIHGSTE